MNWIKVVVVTHIYAHKQELQIFVQNIQALIFYLTRFLISILIDHIFVIAGQERLWWLHWKFHYT